MKFGRSTLTCAFLVGGASAAVVPSFVLNESETFGDDAKRSLTEVDFTAVQTNVGLLKDGEERSREQGKLYAACEYIKSNGNVQPVVPVPLVARQCTSCLQMALSSNADIFSDLELIAADADADVREKALAFARGEPMADPNPELDRLRQVGTGLVLCSLLELDSDFSTSDTFTDSNCCWSAAQQRSLSQCPADMFTVPSLPVSRKEFTLPMLPMNMFGDEPNAMPIEAFGERTSALAAFLTNQKCNDPGGVNCECALSYCRPVKLANAPGMFTAFQAAAAQNFDLTTQEGLNHFDDFYRMATPTFIGEETLPAFLWLFVLHDSAVMQSALGIPAFYADEMATAYGSMKLAALDELQVTLSGKTLITMAPLPTGGVNTTELPIVLQQKLAHLFNAEVASIEFWKWFANNNAGLLSGILLEKIQPNGETYQRAARLFQTPLTGSILNENSLSQELVDGRLYMIDLSVFEDWSEAEGAASRQRELMHMGAAVLLRRTDDGVMPEAVRLSSNAAEFDLFRSSELQTGETTPSAWIASLEAAKSTIKAFGIAAHQANYHNIQAALGATFRNCVTEDWGPLHDVLERQLRYAGQFLNFVMGTVEQVIAPLQVQEQRELLLQHNAEFFNRGTARLAVPSVLQELNGLDKVDFSVNEDWDLLPFMKDWERAYEVADTFARTVVDKFYPTDRDVLDDEQLVRWFHAIGHPKLGNVLGLTNGPIPSSSKAQGNNIRGASRGQSRFGRGSLRRVIALIMYLDAMHGMLRTTPLVADQFLPLAGFSALPIGTKLEPGGTYDPVDLWPSMKHVGGYVRFVSIFTETRPYDPLFADGSGANVVNNRFQSSDVNDAYEAYRQGLLDILDRDAFGNPRMDWSIPVTASPFYEQYVGNIASAVEI